LNVLALCFVQLLGFDPGAKDCPVYAHLVQDQCYFRTLFAVPVRRDNIAIVPGSISERWAKYCYFLLRCPAEDGRFIVDFFSESIKSFWSASRQIVLVDLPPVGEKQQYCLRPLFIHSILLINEWLRPNPNPIILSRYTYQQIADAINSFFSYGYSILHTAFNLKYMSSYVTNS